MVMIFTAVISICLAHYSLSLICMCVYVDRYICCLSPSFLFVLLFGLSSFTTDKWASLLAHKSCIGWTFDALGLLVIILIRQTPTKTRLGLRSLSQSAIGTVKHSFSTFVPSFGRDIKHKLGTCFNLCAFQTQLASSPHSEEFLLTVAFVPLLLLLHSFKGTFSTFPCCCQRCSIVSIFPTLTS